MKTISFLILLFTATIILPKSYCQSPFASEDLNSIQSFYGFWECSFSFTNIATKKLIVIQIRDQGSNAGNIVIYDKEKATATHYYSTFDNGVIKFPFTVVSMANTKDSCKGIISISLLDGQHITGSFLSFKNGCTALQVTATKTDERSVTALQNFKTVASYKGNNTVNLHRYIGTWEGYGDELDSSNVKPEFNYISKIVLQPFKKDNDNIDTLWCQLFIRNLSQINGGATFYLRGVADGNDLRLLDLDSSAFTKEVRIIKLQRDSKGNEVPVLKLGYTKDNKQLGQAFFSYPYRIKDNQEDALSKRFGDCWYSGTHRDSNYDYKNNTCLFQVLTLTDPQFEYIPSTGLIKVKIDRLMPFFIRVDENKVNRFLAQKEQVKVVINQYELPTFLSDGVNYHALNVIMPISATVTSPVLDRPIMFPQTELQETSFAQLLQPAFTAFRPAKQEPVKTIIAKSILPLNNKQEQETVKKAALIFFKWHETDWENPLWEKKPYLMKKRPSLTFIRNRNGKPDQLGNCPCTIDWNALETFCSWIKMNAPIISDNYLSYYKKVIKGKEPSLKKRTEEEYEFQNVVTGYIFWFVFAQDYIYFNQLGIYDSQAKWKVDLTSDSTATATVLFRKEQWTEVGNAFFIQMTKENGKWKLARNVDWAQVDPISLNLVKRETVE